MLLIIIIERGEMNIFSHEADIGDRDFLLQVINSTH